ncbi:helix-turn-helix domain-containing protein [Pseudoalteromonas sp. S16_S37]|uniref:helix-turn-helix domain-containing protein n=1 Tax=Pseudoalteromonas sp. S16_S37 TaxID=2720228 RepID=UPI00168162C5|nr:helix-turn-helix transcriptional regulator [Pseudoalteromonas sp. S16_S37]MBD1584889.1 helix-turn-helix transcriptional regulator [Pseudoalteromonas sp. S16_S37]
MIGTRLKEERKRLGLNQDDFSALAGAKRRALVDWEKGITSPTATQLSMFAEAGVDTQYVLTGKKLTACYSENEILEGISSFLFESAELGWLTKEKNTPFSTVLNFAVFSVKKAAGEDIQFSTKDNNNTFKKEG